MDDWSNYTVIVQVVEELRQGKLRGQVHDAVNAESSASLFLLALCGALEASPGPRRARMALIDELVAGTLRSLR